MANSFYTNNFKGRAGRRERAKHLVDEFKAIEDGFTALQAYNIASYLTMYTNTTSLTGSITIRPDNGYLQELTITENVTIQMGTPFNESQYRVSLLVHGGGFTVQNGWGAQTWKEYGGDQDNWWELFTGDGPYASMLLDFWWDICTHTWICVASSKNILNSAGGRVSFERFYPLLCNLSNTVGDDTWGFTRTGNGNGIDQFQQYHYHATNVARHHGVRWVENWVATASDLTTVEWDATDCTVTTDAGVGPASEDVQRLSFDVQGGKLAKFILPSFGRASTAGDPIEVVVSFKGRAADVANASLRVVNALCGKTNQSPPVSDQVQIELDSTWQTYGCVLDILKDGNDNKSLALDQYYPKCLMEISFMSPSGSIGEDIQITDVQIEVLRKRGLSVPSEIQDTTIGSSIFLSGTGTGTWDDGTKTLTLATAGQSVDLSGTLEAGRTYLVDARLQAGDAADIRMQNDITVWGAGSVSDSLYLQDAPFTFQYDGGNLKFVLMEGISAIYLVDIYKVSNDRSPYCYENQNALTAHADGSVSGLVITSPTMVPYDSGVLFGVAREIQSENIIPYTYFRTFSLWDQVGLSGIAANDCRNPVFQSEYGIDGWPSRATILQGASMVTDGFIQRDFTLIPNVGGDDIQIWIRRTLDVEGNQIYFPQNGDVTVPVSQYVDFEAELLGGTSVIESGRVRLDLQNTSFVGLPSGYNYSLGINALEDWYFINISLQNDGTHDTFRFRVYPASATVPDPSVIDVATQGWCVVDWAQFETTSGTFSASSPMLGGYTRHTEDFTTALPDGEIYATYEDGSFLDEPNKKVADVISGDIIWLEEDYIWRNVVYSTTVMSGISPYNMHEFGLVDNQIPPQSNLQVVTTTPYPIEAVEGAEFSVDLHSGIMQPIVQDQFTHEGDIDDWTLTDIRIESGPHDDSFTHTGDIEDWILTDILITTGPHDDDFKHEGDLIAWVMEDKLVTATAPPEGAEFLIACDESNCTMTPV